MFRACPPPPTSCSPPSTASASRIATVKHPPLFTVEQSQALRGQIPGGHTKNLFLKDKKGALFLVVALEDAAIELKGLHRRLGASGRFSFGSADLLREVLGVEPGAVTPFGAINDTARPRHRRARRRPDGARDAQLSSAGQHHDHVDRARRSGEIPANPPAMCPGSSGSPGPAPDAA